MTVVELPVKYPQGAEKQLIKAVLGREVPPPPGLPMDVGVVVQNVGTCLAIKEAVLDGTPIVERVVTVSGSGIAAPPTYGSGSALRCNPWWIIAAASSRGWCD